MRRLALAGIVAPLLSACLSQPADTQQAHKPGSAKAGATADLNFTGTTLDGNQFEGASLQGKPTVFWFWAPWCMVCLSQSPHVTALGKQYADKVTVIGVSGLATDEMIRDLAPGIHGIIHLVDTEGVIWNHFAVEAQSTFMVIDASGQILANGYVDERELDKLVARIARGAGRA